MRMRGSGAQEAWAPPREASRRGELVALGAHPGPLLRLLLALDLALDAGVQVSLVYPVEDALREVVLPVFEHDARSADFDGAERHRRAAERARQIADAAGIVGHDAEEFVRRHAPALRILVHADEPAARRRAPGLFHVRAVLGP